VDQVAVIQFILRIVGVFLVSVVLRRGADTSLARPGRKQATANKLEIYSV